MITQSAVFRSIAGSVVPALQTLDESGWQRVGEVVERALATRPAGVRRQLALLLRMLNVFALARTGRPLSKLPEPQRTRFLSSVEHSRMVLLRRGFWGLRTLILMGYYTQPGAKAEIGYRATAAGWQDRR